MLNGVKQETISLFLPIQIANITIPNRIVMAPMVSGLATRTGNISNELYNYYMERVHGGVGLIITEPVQVIVPRGDINCSHLGLYNDSFIPQLKQLVQAVHGAGSRIIVTLDAPEQTAKGNTRELTVLTVLFIQAAERALESGCDGVMISMADGGVLHNLVSPLRNKRHDTYGGDTRSGRLRLPLDIIKGIRMYLGKSMVLGFRLVADEFIPGGIQLSNSHTIARHLVAAGINIIDVTTDTYSEVPVAQFPGWRIPLAHSIKCAVPDIPIIGSGLLSNPFLAESFVRDGSVDMVLLERTLQVNPYWPQLAQILLMAEENNHNPQMQPLWGWHYSDMRR